jgi:capsular exopolysaccharide synthesis family protein
MKPKHSALSEVRFSGKAHQDGGSVPEGAKLTAGVPLPKLIKRKMLESPELVLLGQPRSVAAERFRRLKTILLHAEPPPQVVVVTSAAPNEGKSVVATNLALAFAADERGEVLLLDADLRRPTVERWLHPEPKLGLAELLRRQTEVEHVLLELQNSPLRVIPAGTPPRDPVALLSADGAAELMSQLRRRFERIVIDTPPIVPFTDADVIGRLSDGLLVVARCGSTRRAMLQQAIASVTSTRVLGTVLNDVTYSLADRESHYAEGYYHHYYEAERKR